MLMIDATLQMKLDQAFNRFWFQNNEQLKAFVAQFITDYGISLPSELQQVQEYVDNRYPYWRVPVIIPKPASPAITVNPESPGQTLPERPPGTFWETPMGVWVKDHWVWIALGGLAFWFLLDDKKKRFFSLGSANPTSLRKAKTKRLYYLYQGPRDSQPKVVSRKQLANRKQDATAGKGSLYALYAYNADEARDMIRRGQAEMLGGESAMDDLELEDLCGCDLSGVDCVDIRKRSKVGKAKPSTLGARLKLMEKCGTDAFLLPEGTPATDAPSYPVMDDNCCYHCNMMRAAYTRAGQQISKSKSRLYTAKLKRARESLIRKALEFADKGNKNNACNWAIRAAKTQKIRLRGIDPFELGREEQSELFKVPRGQIVLKTQDEAESEDRLIQCLERKGWKRKRIEQVQESIAGKMTPSLFTEQREELTGGEVMFQEAVDDCIRRLREGSGQPGQMALFSGPKELTEIETKFLESLRERPKSMDRLEREFHLMRWEVRRVIRSLEAKGLIRAAGDKPPIQYTPVSGLSGSRRVRYDRGDLDSTMRAAIRTVGDRPNHVYATYYGYTVEKVRPPHGQDYIQVSPGGRVIQYTYDLDKGRYETEDLAQCQVGNLAGEGCRDKDGVFVPVPQCTGRMLKAPKKKKPEKKKPKKPKPAKKVELRPEEERIAEKYPEKKPEGLPRYESITHPGRIIEVDKSVKEVWKTGAWKGVRYKAYDDRGGQFWVRAKVLSRDYKKRPPREKRPPSPPKPEPEPAVPVKDKQPWEMTEEQWLRQKEEAYPETVWARPTKRDKSEAVARAQRIDFLSYNLPAPWDADMQQVRRLTHRDVILAALGDGKPVPKDIVDLYPGIRDEAAVYGLVKRPGGASFQEIVETTGFSIPKAEGLLVDLMKFGNVTKEGKFYYQFNVAAIQERLDKQKIVEETTDPEPDIPEPEPKPAEETKDTRIDPWMTAKPFTDKEISYANMYSHYDIDWNEDFAKQVANTEQETREHLEKYGIDDLTPEVLEAMQQYRKGVYDAYKATWKNRAYYPPVSVVGPSKYPFHRKDRAMKQLSKISDRKQAAIGALQKAVKNATKGLIPKITIDTHIDVAATNSKTAFGNQYAKIEMAQKPHAKGFDHVYRKRGRELHRELVETAIERGHKVLWKAVKDYPEFHNYQNIIDKPTAAQRPGTAHELILNVKPKGGKPRGYHKYLRYSRASEKDKPKYEWVWGKPAIIREAPNHNFFIAKDYGKYVVYEVSSGKAITKAYSSSDAAWTNAGKYIAERRDAFNEAVSITKKIADNYGMDQIYDEMVRTIPKPVRYDQPEPAPEVPELEKGDYVRYETPSGDVKHGTVESVTETLAYIVPDGFRTAQPIFLTEKIQKAERTPEQIKHEKEIEPYIPPETTGEEVRIGDYVEFKTVGDLTRQGTVQNIFDKTVYIVPDGGSNSVPAAGITKIIQPIRKPKKAEPAAEPIPYEVKESKPEEAAQDPKDYELGHNEKVILRTLLSGHVRGFDDIVRAANIEPYKVSASLCILDLKGLVTQLAGKQFQLKYNRKGQALEAIGKDEIFDAVSGKDPWDLDWHEWGDEVNYLWRIKESKEVDPELRKRAELEYDRLHYQGLYDSHEEVVREALKAGYDPPKKVLKHYPTAFKEAQIARNTEAFKRYHTDVEAAKMAIQAGGNVLKEWEHSNPPQIIRVEMRQRPGDAEAMLTRYRDKDVNYRGVGDVGMDFGIVWGIPLKEKVKGFEDFDFYIHRQRHPEEADEFVIVEKSTGFAVAKAQAIPMAKDRLKERLPDVGREKFEEAIENAGPISRYPYIESQRQWVKDLAGLGGF